MTDERVLLSEFRSPDGVVILRCPRNWRETKPVSEDACLALSDPLGSVLLELLTAKAPTNADSQPGDISILLKIAAVTIDGLREAHPDLRVLSPPAGLQDWPESEGVCVHFIVGYPEARVLGKLLSSVTDSFLIGKGSMFIHLNIKCEESKFKKMIPLIKTIVASLIIGSEAQPRVTSGAKSDLQTKSLPVMVENSPNSHPSVSTAEHKSVGFTATKARAESGDAAYQFNLGVMYDSEDGIAPNKAEAARWYRQAAERGLPQAQANLGYMYAHGEGVPKDFAEARRWFQLAADQGFADGEFKLGILYANGWGVNQDYNEAYKWINRAALQGHADAQATLDEVAKRGVQQGIERNGEPVRQPLDKAKTIRDIFVGLFALAILPAVVLAGVCIYAAFHTNWVVGVIATVFIITLLMAGYKYKFLSHLVWGSAFLVAISVGFSRNAALGVIITLGIGALVWFMVRLNKLGINVW